MIATTSNQMVHEMDSSYPYQRALKVLSSHEHASLLISLFVFLFHCRSRSNSLLIRFALSDVNL